MSAIRRPPAIVVRPSGKRHGPPMSTVGPSIARSGATMSIVSSESVIRRPPAIELPLVFRAIPARTARWPVVRRPPAIVFVPRVLDAPSMDSTLQMSQKEFMPPPLDQVSPGGHFAQDAMGLIRHGRRDPMRRRRRYTLPLLDEPVKVLTVTVTVAVDYRSCVSRPLLCKLDREPSASPSQETGSTIGSNGDQHECGAGKSADDAKRTEGPEQGPRLTDPRPSPRTASTWHRRRRVASH
ncbi:hypothetical protein C8Q76DRAFT_708856 [Earliella scabrosa]|nr:hypothetical protein C8Q76DRAFT_708856 [Earliella scabrosa]